MNIDFEDVFVGEDAFPIKIFKRISDHSSAGCLFHWHEALEFYYVKTGGIHLMLNGAARWLTTGTAALVDWCAPHKSLEFLDSTNHYIIQVDINHPVFSMLKNIGIGRFFFEEPEVISHFENLISCFQTKSAGYKLEMLGEIFLIFGKISDPNEVASVSARMKNNQFYVTLQVLKTIHQEFSDCISLDRLSNSAGVSTAHMCRLFKKHTGLTIVQYINHIRFQQAVVLLHAGYSVTQTSEMVGFHDYNYFSRAFKKTMGVSPSKFSGSSIEKKQRRQKD